MHSHSMSLKVIVNLVESQYLHYSWVNTNFNNYKLWSIRIYHIEMYFTSRGPGNYAVKPPIRNSIWETFAADQKFYNINFPGNC